jgi:hypothetical protein
LPPAIEQVPKFEGLAVTSPNLSNAVPEMGVLQVAAGPNVAVTFRAALIVTVQVPVPLQAPDQPVKVEPAVGAAVRVTDVPSAILAEQVLPQLMPAGELTVPVPVPALVTDRL